MFYLYLDRQYNEIPYRIQQKWGEYFLHNFDEFYWILLDIWEDNDILPDLLDELWRFGIDYSWIDDKEDWWFEGDDPRDYLMSARAEQLEEFNELLHRYRDVRIARHGSDIAVCVRRRPNQDSQLLDGTDRG